MRSKFDEQLKNLNEEMIQMGILIEENIQKAIEALVQSDVELAKVIMEKDAIIDRKQREIESICFQLLIQQQPVAKDLRAITAAMKMVTDMERIGDHAADISEITIMLSDSTRNENYDTIIKMATEASVMLIQSIDAFTEKNENKAKAVIDHDDAVDELFDRVKAELIELIKNDPKRGEQEVDMLMIAKYLERIGDHATNIAEWVIYSLDNKVKENQNV
ncbi:MAG: phosphate signaling complex protein PhoU [Lachnospiraceae bacterium]|nr:phosphate signaling complex protein PhoU [Lachnospiraceae bacterium]